jgi:hypothetical protein
MNKMNRRIEKFQYKISTWVVPLLWLCGIFGILLFVAIVIGHRETDFQFVLEAVLIAEAVYSAFLILLFVLVTFTYPVEIFKEGISSYNPFGSWNRDFVKWSSIETLKHKNMLGIRYLILESGTDNKRIWLPLQIRNRKKFTRVISEIAGENHILSVELQHITTDST